MPPPESHTASDAAAIPGKGAPLFGRFVLIKRLGHGGMGQVWLARDQILDLEVALKFLPEMLVNDPAAVEEMRAETRRALRLTHEGIVRTYDFYCAEGTACIAMEHVHGQTLSQMRLRRPDQTFEADQILPWIEQACAAMHYAHEVAKVAHRDLKPSNMMIDETGRVKLADFGVARGLADSVSRVSNRPNSSGTLPFMSPQQLNGEDPSAADDVYAMGATIYELLTSKPPFYSGSIERQIIERIPPSMTDRRAELGIVGDPIPPHWERAVAACLAKSRDARPKSVLDLAAALANPAVAAGAPPPLPPQRPASLPPMPITAPVASAAVLPKYVPPLPSLGSTPGAQLPQYMPPPGATPSSPFPNYPAANPGSGRGVLWVVLGLVVLCGFVVVVGGAWFVLKKVTTAGAAARVEQKSARPVSPPLGAQATPASPPASAEPARSGVGSPVRSTIARLVPVAGTTCQGAFTYNDPQRTHRTSFSLAFTEVTPPDPSSGAVRIAGTITEPRFDFGPPGMQSLQSAISGTWTPTPQGAQIAFTKTYRFDDTPAEFTGTYDAATKAVTGTWNLNGYGGSFSLTGLSTQ